MKLQILTFLSFLFIHSVMYGHIPETPAVMFKHLSTSEGLSNNSVRKIFRDSRGFLWVGTESGLNKFDGYHFQHYYRNNSDLPDDEITDIFEGPENNIWIRMSNGYSIYDVYSGKFNNDYRRVLAEMNIPERNILNMGMTAEGEFWAYDQSKLYIHNASNSSLKVFAIREDNLSNVAIGSSYIYIMYTNGKLYSINKQTSETTEVYVPPVYRELLENREPYVYVDHSGGVWLYTFQNSLLLYSQSPGNGWENIDIDTDKKVQYNRVQQILDIGNGRVCILTSHLGLFSYNRMSKTLFNFVHSPLKPHTIASNNLSAIYQDKDGNIWLGNFKHGISYYSPMSQIIISQKHLEYEDILTFCSDANPEFIFYGTDGTGLIRQSLKTGAYQKISTPANVVVDLAMDTGNRLWIGTYQKGLLCYSEGKVTQYTEENSELLENNVYTVEVDRNGYIWIGTMKGYIQRFDPGTGKFDTILYRPGEFYVRDMYYDNQNTLYVATLGGLIIVDTDTQGYRILSEANHFRENDMLTVYKDSRGLIWIGHSHGLSLWNPETDDVRFIDKKDGLAANLVRAIIEDDNGLMWIATGNGISRIQLTDDSYSIINYSVNDGLICNDTNVHAVLKLDNGNILFGTPQGYETIIPQDIRAVDYNAQLYLTDIEFNSGTSCKDIMREISPEQASSLTVNRENCSFTLSFSAMNLVEPDKVKYAYSMDKSTTNWINAETHKISFLMLPPGSYTLSVKACNAQGIWSPHIKTLKIKVLPPWWRTWWAHTIYACLALSIILLVVRYLRMRYREKQILQAIEHENEEQKKLSNLKLQFFANISHELRTPLSLIINPLEEFFQEHPAHRNGLLGIVNKNAIYLLELINQLLDFRRLDAKAEVLKCKHDNVLIIISEIFHSFDAIARKRDITYTLHSAQHSVFMDFDYDKIRKICTNVLSNAFKFTPNGAEISLNIKVINSNVVMKFADTGCGIEDSAKEKVFNRFYQSDKNQSTTGGSGIGLHIVSEYVRLHQGNIHVEDNHPSGSVFVISLPLHQDINRELLPSVGQNTEKGNHPFTILLVDDNYDFMDFLSGSLSKNYRILKAMNGKQALNVLENEDADLIVSDIMMPEMDGIELCRAVKSDIRYSHIPVILLTAKASDEHQLEGLNTGADDYITKPFNMELLKVRIRKIIEMSAKRKQLFSEQVKIEPSRITITPLDRQLVERAIQLVEDNIGETEFSVEELASGLNISRSYFYKKMIKITGKTPIEFIRTIRMKRARQLLAESQMQVAEIAYMLGYNSPKIFSKHFKEEFNISPSEFIKSNHSGDISPSSSIPTDV